MLNQSVVASQRDHFKAISAQMDAERLAQNRLYITLMSILALIIVSLISVFLFFRSRQKVIMAEYMNNADMMSKSLYETTAEKRKMADSINVLLRDRFTTIDDMIIEYYERGDNSQKHIYEKIKKEIDALKSDNRMLKKLETILNRYNNDIMELVRKELPSLKPDEYRFLCYIYLGFSSQALCIFMNESSIDNIYRKKSRLKSKISASDAPHKELFVACFR